MTALQPDMPAAALDSEPMLFALDSSRTFGEAVAERLGMTLSPHEEQVFEDSEHKLRALTNVRDRDVYVLQSLQADSELSGNDKLMRLLFFIGALRDAGAGRVTAVTPYLAYARMDRKTRPRDPVATRYVAALFEAVGADALLAMDVHNLAAFQNAFRCRTEHLEANPLFTDHFAAVLGSRKVAVVSPDTGGVGRAEGLRRLLADALGHPVAAAFMEKHRHDGGLSGDTLVGDVAGREVVLVDDMVSTGATLARAANACRNAGAAQVHAAISHGLFNGHAYATLSVMLDSMVVTDTVPPPADAARPPLTVLSCAPLFAEAIGRLHTGGSVSALAQG
jgi:ribose-phosphate pyrophosphokinase